MHAEREESGQRIVRAFGNASLPRIRFGAKTGRNARIIKRMIRHPQGLVVNRQGRVLAMWGKSPTSRPPDHGCGRCR
ncbi:MAG: hypothetical protein U0R64_01910 [Candidatus Nanopelagicales bacterium]